MNAIKLSWPVVRTGGIGFALNMLLGVVYAWSVFVSPLEVQFGWTRAETSLVFSASMVCLCLGHLVSGILLPCTSPCWVLLLSAVLSGVGFLASASGSSLEWFIVSYGICCGLAVGLGANCVLSTALLWFPQHRGLASGVLLSGVGLGSLVFGVPITEVIDTLGWQAAFVLLGIVFALALGVGAFLLKRPSLTDGVQSTFADSNNDTSLHAPAGMDTKAMVHTPSFWGFFCWITLIGIGGLALISNAVPAAALVVHRSGAGAEVLMFATAAMGLIGMANGGGRLASGWLWDRFGFRTTLAVVSLVLFVAMLLCIVADQWDSSLAIIVGFLLLGASYGGSISAGSALVGSFYGMKHYPLNYAVVSLNILVASLVGPAVISLSWDLSGSYFAAYIILALLSLVALAIALCLREP